jgi:putative N6-adenine-specific DNA methylase
MKWDRKMPFISPMCGSGTPAIEAALAAIGRAPGSLRSHFGFMSLKGYGQIIPGEKAPRVAPRQRFGATPEQIWKDMVLEAQEQEKTEGIPPIIATDISPEAVQNAQVNAHAAGVTNFIQFKACDFGDTPIPDFAVQSGAYRGCVFFNPEYGIRLGDPAELVPIYERIGTFMNEKCPGYIGAVLTGSPELSKMINLYYVTRIPFYNGPIDCRLFIFPNCELKGANTAKQE